MASPKEKVLRSLKDMDDKRQAMQAKELQERLKREFLQRHGKYHGIWKGEHYWRQHCRRLGAPMKRPGQMTPTQHKQANAA
jgi:hypothetical protein